MKLGKINFFRLGYYLLLCRLARRFNRLKPLPINVTLSITNKCISRCRTCNIWKMYIEKPELINKELNSKEWGLVLRNIGSAPFWVTVSGGNQFLRDDLINIISHVVNYCNPAIINIPVSGLLPERIYATMLEILKICNKRGVSLIANISLDGIGEKQDDIRGIKGDFVKTVETHEKLMKLKDLFDNFYVGIYSVVSVFNANDIPEICNFVENKLNPDNYIIEIAGHRKELNNLAENILPSREDYTSAINYYLGKIRNKDTKLSRLRQSMRQRYYSLIGNGEIIPCYAGIASAHISPHGDVYPCCTKAEVLGNLRSEEYDFKKIWFSTKARLIQKTIKDKKCHCVLGNPYYTNMLLDPRSISEIFIDYFKNKQSCN